MSVADTIRRPAAGDGRADDNERIALYVRLSRIFRQHIASGVWKRGGRVPTIPELCREYQVAAITVRQALALLSNDGLIVSRRGSGTYVTDAPLTANFPAHQATSEDLHTPLPATRIKVLRRERSVALPAELSSDKDDVSYAHLSKVHDSGSTPFVMMDIYVTSRAYDRFPKGADDTTRISELFREHSGISVAHDRQLFTISYADRIAAQHLKCSLGSVLMQMRSWWFDEAGKVVFAGNFLYRGDMFLLERGGIHPTHGLVPTAQTPPPKSKEAGRPPGRSGSKPPRGRRD